MTRDFMIILNKKYSIKFLNNVIDETVGIECRIKVSNNNHIIIAKDANMMLDMDNKIIKVRIYEKSGQKEIGLVEDMIKRIGQEKAYVHFYGRDNFISPQLNTI